MHKRQIQALEWDPSLSEHTPEYYWDLQHRYPWSRVVCHSPIWLVVALLFPVLCVIDRLIHRGRCHDYYTGEPLSIWVQAKDQLWDDFMYAPVGKARRYEWRKQ